MSAGGIAAGPNPNTQAGGSTGGPFMGGTPAGSAPLAQASGPMGGRLMGGAPLNNQQGRPAPSPGGTFFGGNVGPNMQGDSTGMHPMGMRPVGMPQYGGPDQPQANKLQYGPVFDDTPINQQYGGTGQATMKGMSPFNMQGPDIQRLLQQYQSGQGGQGGKGGMPQQRMGQRQSESQVFRSQPFGQQPPPYDGGGKTAQMAIANNARQQAEFLARGPSPHPVPHPVSGGLEALLGNMAGKKSSTNSLQ